MNEEYETKMVGFEVDCNDGKGEPAACQHVGEFFSAVKQEYARAVKVYELNCNQNHYASSCFSYAKMLRECS